MKCLKNTMSKRNLRQKAFNWLFAQYTRYLEYELANSIYQNAKYPKDTNVLISFRDTFYWLVTSYYEIEKSHLVESNKKIRKSVSKYIGGGNGRKRLNLRFAEVLRGNLCFMDLIDKDFKNLLSDYSNSCDDFRSIDRIKDERIANFEKDKKERSLLLQSLLEFNNAFSHLAVIFCNGEDLDGNMQKAKSHLYRGCLDNYKMLLRFIMPKINSLKVEQSFLEIREHEFLLLGKNINNKPIDYTCPITNKKSQMTLSKAYKELFNTAFSKLPREYLKP